MSSFNCCFLTCIQVSQEVVKVVWWSHPFKNFPQFVVIHTVKGFSIVNEAEVDVFLEFFCWGGTNWKSRYIGIYMSVSVIESCLTLCDPMDCSPPDSSIHGILQARILEWVAIPSSGRSWDLPNPGIEPGSSTLQADSLPSEPPENPYIYINVHKMDS